jgi:hypothetical protein
MSGHNQNNQRSSKSRTPVQSASNRAPMRSLASARAISPRSPAAGHLHELTHARLMPTSKPLFWLEHLRPF